MRLRFRRFGKILQCVPCKGAVWLCGVLSFALPRSASAVDANSEKLHVTLRSSATECITSDELQQLVLRQSAALPLVAESIEIAVRIEPDQNGGWTVQVRLGSFANEPSLDRTFHTPARNCRDLDPALALVIDVLLESLTKLNEPMVEAQSAPPQTTVTITAEEPFVTKRTSIAATPWTLDAGGALALGLMDSPVFLGRVTVHGRLSSRLNLLFGVGLTPFGDTVRVDSASVQLRAFSARVAPCFTIAQTRTTATDVCVGADIGWITTRDHGTDGPESTNRIASWGLAQIGSRFRLTGRLFGALDVVGGPALLRISYKVDDLQGRARFLRHPQPWFLEGGAALGVELP